MHDSADLKSAVSHFPNQLDVPVDCSTSQLVGCPQRLAVIRSGDGD
jgi:hypothetical protein